MKELKFSYNWNNKLDCKAFTTLRLSNKYFIGDELEVILNKKVLYNATIIDKKTFKMKDITDWVAYIDTGYDKNECTKILERMYSKRPIEWNTQDIHFYLIKRNKNDKDNS